MSLQSKSVDGTQHEINRILLVSFVKLFAELVRRNTNRNDDAAFD